MGLRRVIIIRGSGNPSRRVRCRFAGQDPERRWRREHGRRIHFEPHNSRHLRGLRTPHNFGATEVAGSGEGAFGGTEAVAIRASWRRTRYPAGGPEKSMATRTARLSPQITTSNVLVICWARLLP